MRIPVTLQLFCCGFRRYSRYNRTQSRCCTMLPLVIATRSHFVLSLKLRLPHRHPIRMAGRSRSTPSLLRITNIIGSKKEAP